MGWRWRASSCSAQSQSSASGPPSSSASSWRYSASGCGREGGVQNRGRARDKCSTVLTQPSVGYVKFSAGFRHSSCDEPDQQSSRRRSGPMSPVIITLLVLMGVGLLLAIWLMSIYNGLVVAGNRFKNAFAQIDVQLKRRYELIPNLVEAVIRARNSAMAAEQKVAANPSDPAAMRELNQAETQLGGTVGRLFALSEAYPDLKANQNMLALQEELTSTENKIGFARQAFNDAAANYNIRREVFPAVKVAGIFGFKEAALLETAESERAAPKVSFR